MDLDAKKASLLKEVQGHLLRGEEEAADAALDRAASEGFKSICDKNFYHRLIIACANAGSPAASGWVVDRMARSGRKPNVVTFNSVINAWSKVADVEQAIKWFETMLARRLRPNFVTYNTIITAHARAGDISGAKVWKEIMMDSGVEPDIQSFSTIIDACVKAGSMHQAEDLFEEMLQFGISPDAVIFNFLIKCAKEEEPHKAEAWLMRMQEAKLQPDEKTYNRVIKACARLGEVGRAEHWFHAMERDGYRLDNVGFAAVIHASAKTGDVVRAEWWFEEMLRRKISPNVLCFNTVLHACAQAGNRHAALRWIKSMQSAGLQPDNTSFNNLFDSFKTVGVVPALEAWLNKMVCGGLHPDKLTLSTLARICAVGHRQGNGKIQPADAHVLAYDLIVNAYNKARKPKCAQQWVQIRNNAGTPAHTGHESKAHLAAELGQLREDVSLGEPQMKSAPPCSSSCIPSAELGIGAALQSNTQKLQTAATPGHTKPAAKTHGYMEQHCNLTNQQNLPGFFESLKECRGTMELAHPSGISEPSTCTSAPPTSASGLTLSSSCAWSESATTMEHVGSFLSDMQELKCPLDNSELVMFANKQGKSYPLYPMCYDDPRFGAANAAGKHWEYRPQVLSCTSGTSKGFFPKKAGKGKGKTGKKGKGRGPSADDLAEERGRKLASQGKKV